MAPIMSLGFAVASRRREWRARPLWVPLLLGLLFWGVSANFPAPAFAQSVVRTNPVTNTVGAPVTSTVAITFSTAVNLGNVTPSNFRATSSYGVITGTLSAVSATVTMTPSRPFFPGAQVQVVSTSAIRTAYQWGFTTAPAATPNNTLFTNAAASAPLAGVAGGAAAWGDVDNDGDLDLAITGRGASGTPIARLYRNNGGGAFADSGVALTGVISGTMNFADVDRDNDLDLLITGRENSSTLRSRLFLNNGSGAFTDSGVSLTGLERSAVAFGDVDNDGDVDFVMTGSSSAWGDNQFTQLYYNQGNGTFSGSWLSPYLVDSAAALGDVDSDGDLDLVLTGWDGSARVTSLLRNSGSGSFSSYATLTGVRNGAVAFGDVDRDRDLDLLVTGEGSGGPTATLYLNNGSGAFTASGVSLPGVRGGAAALIDVEGDGDLDIFLSGTGVGNVLRALLYRNSGTGTFTVDSNQPLIEVGASFAAFGDYDNDSDLDLFFAGDYVNIPRSRLYENRLNTGLPGSLPLTTTVFGAGVGTLVSTPAGINCGINCTANFALNTVVTLTMSGVPGYPFIGWTGACAGTGACVVRIGESTQVTATYRPPLLSRYPVTHAVNAALTDTIRVTFAGTLNPADVMTRAIRTTSTAGHISGTAVAVGATVVLTPSRPFFPGEQVRVQATSPFSETYWWSFTASPNATPNNTFFSNPAVSAALLGVAQGKAAWGDVDNDGDLDLVVTGRAVSGPPQTRLYRNNGGGSFTDSGVALTGVMSSTVNFADIDGDRDLDLLITGRQANDMSVGQLYLNNGSGSFLASANSFMAVRNGAVAFGDVDNDGDLDLIMIGNASSWEGSSGSISYSRNQGNGTFQGENFSAQWYARDGAVAFADVDNDSDLDLLITGWDGTARFARLFRNDGSGTFTLYADLLGVRFSAAAFGDVDSDGDLDLLLAGQGDAGRSTTLYLNNGSGAFTASSVTLPGVSHGEALLVDVDGDRDLDIFLAGTGVNDTPLAAIYRNNGSATFALDAGIPLLEVGASVSALGDYDNDGDLDIFLAGDSGSAPRTRIYENQPSANLPSVLALEVVKYGGAGRVTSIPSGIDCGVTCTATFALDSTVTLTVSETGGLPFAGWAGACVGTGPCVVKIRDATRVAALFSKPLVASYSPAANAPSVAVGNPSCHLWVEDRKDGRSQDKENCLEFEAIGCDSMNMFR